MPRTCACGRCRAWQPVLLQTAMPVPVPIPIPILVPFRAPVHICQTFVAQICTVEATVLERNSATSEIRVEINLGDLALGLRIEPDRVYRRRFSSYSAAIVTGIKLS
jgi:hypothetical protein